MKLSAVIVNFNTQDYLRTCLSALRASTLTPEIIVVDNDGSAAPLAAEFPEIVYLSQPENRWFCGGNKIGIAVAQGDYVLLLNPDTAPQPDALAVMVAFLDSHPDYRGVTLQLRYPDGSIQRTCSRVPTYTALVLNHTPLGILFSGWRQRVNAPQWYAGWERDTARDVEVMPGSCLMMRRADLHIDDSLLLYFPEDDLARRYHGDKFRFLASTTITHHEKSVTRSWRATQIYYRDMLVYTRKHHGTFRAGLLWLLSRPLYWAMALKHRQPL